MPFWAQATGGFLALELGIYVWHRTMHKVDPLWRWFHQMHHSAERVDIWGAFYFSPLDMLFGTFRNPREFEGEAGFWDGASARVGAMLIGRDVAQ